MSRWQTIYGQVEPLKTNEWFTPTYLIDMVKKFYQYEFSDVASSEKANNYIKANKIFTIEDNALEQEWITKKVWLNPPYSHPLIERFVKKAIYQQKQHQFELIMLVNNCTETKCFQLLAKNAEMRIDIKTRLKFWHPEKKYGSNPSGQCLFYMGDRTTEFVNQFGQLGLVYGKPLQ